MGQKSVLFIFLFVIFRCQSLSVYNIDSWNVTLNSMSTNASGVNGIYSIGAQLGMVPTNLYFQKDDSDARWLAYENWIYVHNFNVDDLLNYEHINLVLDGIDQVANITLNDVQIATTSNMFVQYVYGVKQYLKSGTNTLKIVIISPLEEAYRRYVNRPYIIPPECPATEFNGDCHVNMLRKMQASFSWDWGPSIPSMGIWKPAYFEGYDDTFIRHLVTDVENFNETFWAINVDVYFTENPTDGRRIIGTLATKLENEIDDVETVNITANANGEFVFSVSYIVAKSNVETWWPNGYGEHRLYYLNVYFTSSNQQTSAVRNRIGFRTVELVQDNITPDDGTPGLSFYFKVNNVPIFMKGSNFIPADLRPELGQDRDKIQKLFSSATWANMNMLRIWGGGVYESDVLYELADEMGILLWQDFMFACALYPTDATFLDSVKEEVRYQVKRLHSHPSIVAWAGNNENEGALMDNWWGVLDKTPYINDYVKLYITTIKAEFDRLTHNRGIFVSSSPSNGKKTEQDGWLSENVGNNYYGDVHFYNYADNPFNPATFPIPRFCSEYGYQSLPNVDSFLKDTTGLSDLALDSDFMNYRQHHPGGNTEILTLMRGQLELPDADSANYIEGVAYYSQIIQAYAYKIETEHYRNYRSILAPDGRGHTMGALYWQLNDVWTAPTWSSIDFYGRWKMAHYFARNFFSDVIVSGHIGNWEGPTRTLTVYSVTDTQILAIGKLVIEFKLWNGTVLATEQLDTIEQVAGSSKALYYFGDLDTYITDRNFTAADVYIYLTLTSGDQTVAENYVLPATLKQSNLLKPIVTITSVTKQNNAEAYDVVVSGSEGVALFVWLDSHSILGHFSDNGFLLQPGSKTVTFYSDSTTSAENVRKALSVVHLRDRKFFP